MSSQKQQGGKGGQKARKTKRSIGVHGGGGKTRLTTVQKVLIGNGGLYRTWKPDISPKTPAWRGVDGVPAPAFPEQARENKRVYPHLFAQ